MATRGTAARHRPQSNTAFPLPLSEAVITRIADLYVTGGISTYAIARQLGIDRQRVTRILHKQGILVSPKGKGRSRPRRVPDAPSEDDLRRLYVEQHITTPAIGRMLGVSDRGLRDRLAQLGIPRRHRGGWDRRDRADVEPHDLHDLYVQEELPAEAVGNKLGVSPQIVLRAAHNHGLPVRAGGSAVAGTADVQLIEALYQDPGVRRTLRAHHVPSVMATGTLCERFPIPVPLTADLVRELYLDCGLSSFQIELVTGQPSITILRKLKSAGVERRPRGGLSPFMARWRQERAKTRSRRQPRRRSSTGDYRR